ncbi:sensor histidine kinase [Salipaludibacillus neizhouensis]|uniref:histidine kinase n=1 Tax=Salipaludibacillus neizhouensis TaxID=885475 RepID=A0A3A9KK41_9BACI|nr:sensor histidine kinase [Salipaludibacillus neizhouensis]RKL68155.1 sensor histidine kinase [Salipaludibacillus neizhouensis]
MRAYWIWFLLLTTVWFFAIYHIIDNPVEAPLRIVGSAVFFTLFFISPLFRKKQDELTYLLCAAALLSIITLWPVDGIEPNPYTLLVFSILAGKAVYRLKPFQAFIVGGILVLGAVAPGIAGYSSFSVIFMLLYAVSLCVAFIVYRKLLNRTEDSSARYEALLSEYRKMRRSTATDEELARQEERSQIGRDIHDSVGHKLTALLMQLEVFRMQADGETEKRLEELKKLTKESLEETRKAVKVLRDDQVGGISAVINLIRKLEAESFIRIQFSVKHGVMSAPLENEQAIVIYRAVQEGLTNIMRHTPAREAEIMFEAPGKGVFRFEVSNSIKEKVNYREGFGLTSMRERIEKIGGQLEIVQYDGRFIIRGTLSLKDRSGVSV